MWTNDNCDSYNRVKLGYYYFYVAAPSLRQVYRQVPQQQTERDSIHAGYVKSSATNILAP
jgi:hypothetical protein